MDPDYLASDEPADWGHHLFTATHLKFGFTSSWPKRPKQTTQLDSDQMKQSDYLLF